MASNSRKQIESWLKTIDVKGSVIDVGGLFMPIKGRTKSWEVEKYCLTDIKVGRKGIQTQFIWDFNVPLKLYDEYDNAFCIEVIDHFWNPVVAFQNMHLLLKKGGKLYTSSNFLFPHHTGFDCIRLTKTGLRKVLEETGFKVISIEPRYGMGITPIQTAMALESKVDYAIGEIGYMCIAEKV